MQLTGRWHFELVTADVLAVYRVHDVIHTSRTQYQSVDVLDTPAFGRCLVLDDKTQSTEVDEHIYHESLVHPAMLLHAGPKSVFIGGGGEGATLREVLRHPSVERVVMVDLDREAVRICRDHLPNHHQGSFDDLRLELRHEDAREYLRTCDKKFDVLVLDLVDPIEEGPAYLLYTREFYEIAQAALNPGGMLVTQSGPTALINYQECFTPIVKTLGQVFPSVAAYTVFVPAFTTLWGFTLAFTEGAVPAVPPADMLPEDVDRLIEERLGRELLAYDGTAHRRIFSLPKHLRKGIAQEPRIVTDDTPVFMV